MYSNNNDEMCLDPHYIYGGNAQFASNGMDALPSFRQNGVLKMKIYKQSVKEEFKKLIWDIPIDKDASQPRLNKNPIG